MSTHFGEKTLLEMTADDIREYQKARMRKASASCINHECSLLQQMLKRVACWQEIRDDYETHCPYLKNRDIER